MPISAPAGSHALCKVPHGPIVIGGTGGSGTRALRSVLMALGVYMGHRVNAAGDALGFEPLLERHINNILECTHTLDYRLESLPSVLRADVQSALIQSIEDYEGTVPAGAVAWGWKNPRSIFLLPFLAQICPHLRYLHLVRDGRDIALSENQNQRDKRFPPLFGSPIEAGLDPRARSFAMWTRVNESGADAGTSLLSERYTILRFEDLCDRPEKVIPALCQRLSLSPTRERMDAALGYLQVPHGIGRWRSHLADVIVRLQAQGAGSLERFGYRGVRGTSRGTEILAPQVSKGPLLLLGAETTQSTRLAAVLQAFRRSAFIIDDAHSSETSPRLSAAINDLEALALDEGGTSSGIPWTNPLFASASALVLAQGSGAVIAPGSHEAARFWIRWCERFGLVPDVLIILGNPRTAGLQRGLEQLLELELWTRGAPRFVTVSASRSDTQQARDLLHWVADGPTDDADVETVRQMLSRAWQGADPDFGQEEAVIAMMHGLAREIAACDSGASQGLEIFHHLVRLGLLDPKSPVRTAEMEWPIDAQTAQRELVRLTEQLQADFERIFQSLTWRLGRVFAEPLRVLFRLPPVTVRDHVGELRQCLNTWKTQYGQYAHHVVPWFQPTDGDAARLRVAGLVSQHSRGAPLASAYIRLLLPLTHSSVESHLEFRAIERGDLREPWPDILIVQRSALPDQATAERVIQTCNVHGTRLVLEIDDDLFALGGHLPFSGSYPRPALAALRRVARSADLVVTSTEPLQRVMLRFNANVVVVPNALDECLWFDDSANAAQVPGGDPDGPLRMLYMGTRTHADDLRMLLPALRRLHREYGDRVRVEVIGAVPHGWSKLPEIIHLVQEPVPENYPDFVAWLREHNRWQVGLVPLRNSRLNQSKSYLKLLDYAALRLATVCSDAPAYRPIANNGFNALCAANTTQSWYEALERLVTDSGLRRTLAENARAELVRNHLLRTHARKYANALLGLRKLPLIPADALDQTDGGR